MPLILPDGDMKLLPADGVSQADPETGSGPDDPSATPTGPDFVETRIREGVAGVGLPSAKAAARFASGEFCNLIALGATRAPGTVLIWCFVR